MNSAVFSVCVYVCGGGCEHAILCGAHSQMGTPCTFGQVLCGLDAVEVAPADGVAPSKNHPDLAFGQGFGWNVYALLGRLYDFCFHHFW